MSVPEWLKRHLTELGQWNSDGISRRVRVQTHQCGAAVLVGLDEERGGLAVAAQPDTLDVVGELLALAGGRGTYDLRGVLTRLRLDRRESFRIARSPAGSTRAPYVVAEHRCGQPLPADGPFPHFRRGRNPSTATEPPF